MRKLSEEKLKAERERLEREEKANQSYYSKER